MQLTHIRRADLNLLYAAFILLEERQVSKAADRYHLSQPAMSRVLRRLRETFGDELLVRTRTGFEPTVRGRKVLHELEEILPRLESLLRGGGFDPATAEDLFRLGCTDYATIVLGSSLFERVFGEAPRLSLELISWHDGAFNEVERGRLDLVLWVNEVPEPLYYETLFEEDFVCVLSSDHPVARGSLKLYDYLLFPHVVVNVLGGRQTIVDERLHTLGLSRKCGLQVPYFSGAMSAVARTSFIATVPRRLARLYASNAAIRIVKAPVEFGSFRYVMGWHPRAEEDPAHIWLRRMIRDTARGLG